MTSVQFVLIFAQPMYCSSVYRLRLPNNHRGQPVTEPKPMLLITYLTHDQVNLLENKYQGMR